MFNANVLMSRKQAHAMDIQRFYSPPVNNSRVQSFGKTAAVAYAPDSMVNIIDMRSRRRRVWKACERCRTKKIKCNGELPCIRCKTDGILCRPSVHRKIIYKQLPRGYVEGLESTQLTLTATIRELYSKLHSVGAWEYGEPDLDDCGQPIVQSIAQKLDFVRPKRVTGLPYMALPGKNASSITGPTCQLGGQRPQDYNELWASLALAATQESASFAHYRADKVLHSWSHSDGEQDYPRQAFQQNLSPIPLQNSAAENDFDFIMASVNPGYASIFSAELLSPTDFPPLPDTITDIEWISTEGAVLL